MSHPLFVTLFALLMVPGIFGVLLPFIPGIPFMFLVTILFGFADSFIHLVTKEVIILASILVISLIVDYTSGFLGAKYGGANWRSVLGGVIGFICGLIAFPPLGSIIGLFLGIIAGELMQGKNRHHAMKAATASLLGTLTGSMINVVLAIIYLILFIYFAL